MKRQVTLEQLDGIDLRFGNERAAVQMVEKIARCDGVGGILAQGSAKAATIFGAGTDEFLITVKGQELPAHMPQKKASLGLIYAVNPFGADHQSSEHDAAYIQQNERMAELGLTNPQTESVLNDEKPVLHISRNACFQYGFVVCLSVRLWSGVAIIWPRRLGKDRKSDNRMGIHVIRSIGYRKTQDLINACL
jgi:aldehyde:ferredoxin oxidoreductase